MSETEFQSPLFDEFAAISAEEWRAAVRDDLGGADPDDFLEWSSIEDLSIPAYLQREDLEDLPHVASDAKTPPLADSTEHPANEWALCQTINHPDLDTANKHARTALNGGANALHLSHSPASRECSLHLSDPKDFCTLLDGVEVTQTALHLGDGLDSPVLYGALREHLSGRGADADALHGSVRYDPVAALATGRVGGVDRVFSLAQDLLRNTAAFPHFRSASVDGRVYHDAGASAVQELAYMLGNLTERLARGIEQGIALTTLLDELQFIVSVSTPYFVEIAKLRALRLLVRHVLEAFVEEHTDLDTAPANLRIHAETSRRAETIFDPYVNMLRGTTEAMAAVIGGCDTLTVRPYDAALRPPDAFSLRIARNVQLILEHEAHLDQVADPTAGSYYVEAMTDKLAQRTWDQFQQMEAEGGIVEALRSGTLQEQIAETRQERRDAIDEREQILVGTTHYPARDERRRDDLVHSDSSPDRKSVV